jgi:hypothetical protein
VAEPLVSPRNHPAGAQVASKESQRELCSLLVQHNGAHFRWHTLWDSASANGKGRMQHICRRGCCNMPVAFNGVVIVLPCMNAETMPPSASDCGLLSTELKDWLKGIALRAPCSPDMCDALSATGCQYNVYILGKTKLCSSSYPHFRTWPKQTCLGRSIPPSSARNARYALRLEGNDTNPHQSYATLRQAATAGAPKKQKPGYICIRFLIFGSFSFSSARCISRLPKKAAAAWLPWRVEDELWFPIRKDGTCSNPDAERSRPSDNP